MKLDADDASKPPKTLMHRLLDEHAGRDRLAFEYACGYIDAVERFYDPPDGETQVRAAYDMGYKDGKGDSEAA